ncbi:MAG TPA: hypothetical protein VGE52_12990 [Pirellulales bacterium]
MSNLSPASAQRMRLGVWWLFAALAANLAAISVRRLFICWLTVAAAQLIAEKAAIEHLRPKPVPAVEGEEGAFQVPLPNGEMEWKKDPPPEVQRVWDAKIDAILPLGEQVLSARDGINGTRLFVAALLAPMLFGVISVTPPDAPDRLQRQRLRFAAFAWIACAASSIAVALPDALPFVPADLADQIEPFTVLALTFIVIYSIAFARDCCIPYRTVHPPLRWKYFDAVLWAYVILGVGAFALNASIGWKLAASFGMTVVEAWLLWVFYREAQWTAGELTEIEHQPYTHYVYHDYDEDAVNDDERD